MLNTQGIQFSSVLFRIPLMILQQLCWSQPIVLTMWARQANVKHGETVVVFGMGPMGLIASRIIRA
ncbi:MAG: hypothetical protein ACLTW9_10225 [Enterocloster sp.]